MSQKDDAIRRIEEVEDELAEIARQSVDARADKIDEIRRSLTDARSDLVEAELDELTTESEGD